MRCEICKKPIRVNYGNSYHIFCKDCRTSAMAQQLMRIEKNQADPEIIPQNNIDIPLRTAVISLLIIVASLGLISLITYQLDKNYNSQFILTILAGIVLISIMANIARNIYYRRVNSNKIIAQSVKNKLNSDIIIGTFTLATAIVGFIVIGTKIHDSYVYLLQEKYLHNMLETLNPELMGELKDYAYTNGEIMLYHTILTIQEGFLRLLTFFVVIIVGISHLHYGFYSDSISKIGVLTRGGLYKWKEFTSYSWGKYYNEQAVMNSTGYYDLELTYKNGKILAYILKKQESKITLKINTDDKEKVDNFLSSVLHCIDRNYN